MSPTTTYVVQALFWITVMAAIGLAARPIINKIGRDRDDR